MQRDSSCRPSFTKIGSNTKRFFFYLFFFGFFENSRRVSRIYGKEKIVTHKNSLHVYIDIGKRNQIKTTRDSVVIEKKNCTGTLEATFGTKETLYGSSPNGLVLLLLLLLLFSPSFFFFFFFLLLASHLILFLSDLFGFLLILLSSHKVIFYLFNFFFRKMTFQGHFCFVLFGE